MLPPKPLVQFYAAAPVHILSAVDSRDVPAAEFVRDRILEIARVGPSAESTSIPTSLVPLIERTFRYTWMLATRMRDDMTADGRAEELERLVSEARKLQDSLRDSTSN